MRRPPIPCTPPRWARGGHLQTLLGHFLPSRVPEPRWQPVAVPLADGDVLQARLAEGTSDRVVHLFHGLGGSTEADYMRRSAAVFAAAGDTVLAVNHRGAGEGLGLARQPYHMGSTLDMAEALRAGRERFPRHRHLAIGFSLSASVLLLLLGRDREAPMPDAAIAVNPPVDLERCSHRLLRGLNRAYDLRFVAKLRRHIRELHSRTEVSPFATLREFDEAYTARAAGFMDREDYYTRCACGPHLAEIQVPTVLLTAQDDPFASPEDLQGLPLSPSLHVHAEATGGHMGYLARGVPRLRWLDYALAHYADELFQAGRPA